MTASPRNERSIDAPWPDCPVSVRPATAEELAAPLADDVLAAVAYQPPRVPVEPDPRRVIAVLPLLRAAVEGEVWVSRSPVTFGQEGAIGWTCNDELLLLQMRLPADDLEQTEDATERLYGELMRFVEAKGYPFLLRIWNYLGRINEGEGDAERYRRFCVGRHRVIGDQPNYERRLPAATVIGMADGGLVVKVLAARRPGQQVESPVQMNAWRYPRAYGPRSPGFSRAMLAPWADGAHLLVSGTASVLGHSTVHSGDARAQLRQTMANIEALVTQPGLSRRGFLPEYFVLYLRNRDDYTALQPLLDRYFANTPLQVFEGDICRRDLLLEIEGIYRVPSVLAR